MQELQEELIETIQYLRDELNSKFTDMEWLTFASDCYGNAARAIALGMPDEAAELMDIMKLAIVNQEQTLH